MVVHAWAGVCASTYLGKTAGATWVRCLECIPPASMRAASLSHLEDCNSGALQFALYPLVAILAFCAQSVNSKCVNNAVCNEIVIAKSIENGYNDCRLQ